MNNEKLTKEIQELADDIFINCPACLFEDECEMIARYVIETKGYRKASDVAREVIGEITDFMWQGESEKLNISFNNRFYNKQEFIAELKKKYESEATNHAS